MQQDQLIADFLFFLDLISVESQLFNIICQFYLFVSDFNFSCNLSCSLFHKLLFYLILNQQLRTLIHYIQQDSILIFYSDFKSVIVISSQLLLNFRVNQAGIFNNVFTLFFFLSTRLPSLKTNTVSKSTLFIIFSEFISVVSIFLAFCISFFF